MRKYCRLGVGIRLWNMGRFLGLLGLGSGDFEEMFL